MFNDFTIKVEVGLKEATLEALKSLFNATAATEAKPAPVNSSDAPKAEQPAEPAQEAPAEPAKEITNTELNDAIKAALSLGKGRDAVKTLLKDKFNVDYSREIPQEQRSSFLTALNAL